MNDRIKGAGIGLLLKNPVVLFFILIVALLVFLIVGAAMVAFMGSGSKSEGSGAVSCSSSGLNRESFEKTLNSAGAFAGYADAFIEAGEKHQVDPVLLAAIAFSETGRGTSNAVNNKNNPGGIMDPATNWQTVRVFASLEEGIDYMAGNLYRLYISKGLVTIDQIGNKYAPIGAENDPNNLNANWIPTVTSITAELGGLTMNCTVAGLDGDMVLPTPTINKTSNFGWRVDPFDGSQEFHKGQDLACNKGDTIKAAMTGEVAYAIPDGYGSGYGHHVVLKHGDKYTLYGHMEDVLVRVGEQVQAGQQVGTCGETGAAKGTHLHFEIQLGRPYGERIDPLPYLEGAKKIE
ncbi:peptidoglycan DD-metalloendopeptidase family protein [Bacillus sp. 1P06AnD]|uniref:peptidoglycan DD-metalloendopeptidase family protein n=1 Tax=Bacillus sp. 1P06AnD TaxID=3132208 RepID=UPI0039A2E3E6